jgi:hypothetical protein
VYSLVHVLHSCPSHTTVFQAVPSGLACMQYLIDLHILLLKKCLKVVVCKMCKFHFTEYSSTGKWQLLLSEVQRKAVQDTEVHTLVRTSYSALKILSM